MEWIQFFGFILTIGGLFLWNRTESNADRRELRLAMESQLSALQTASTNQLNAIQAEMKDFHARLLVLEDRYLRLREKD